MSNPDFSGGIKEKGRGIFNKMKKGSGYANLNIVDEKIEQRSESPNETSPTKSASPKPLFKAKKSKLPRVLGDDDQPPPLPSSSAFTATEQLTETTKSSPVMIERSASKGKKRPPPPKPQPFAKTHPNQAAKLNLLLQAKSEDVSEKEDDEIITFKVDSKKSNSMEDLLKNLEDFENAETEDRSGSVSSNQMSSIEYETYDRPQTLETQQPVKDVETIKISEYKSDSENDDIDTDDQLDDEEQTETAQEQKPKHTNGQEMSSLKVSSAGDEWKPHEWVPSPEPPTRKARKPPSWSFDIKNSPQPGRSNGGTGGSITKANSFDQNNSEPPMVMARPRKSSASLKKPPPNVPAPSLPSNAQSSPQQVQKPVAPPRNKKKGNPPSPAVSGKRAPTRAPPPVPATKPTAFPTSKSDIGIHSSSNSSGLQRR